MALEVHIHFLVQVAFICFIKVFNVFLQTIIHTQKFPDMSFLTFFCLQTVRCCAKVLFKESTHFTSISKVIFIFLSFWDVVQEPTEKIAPYLKQTVSARPVCTRNEIVIKHNNTYSVSCGLSTSWPDKVLLAKKKNRYPAHQNWCRKIVIFHILSHKCVIFHSFICQSSRGSG